MSRKGWNILLIAGRLALSISMVRMVSNNQFNPCTVIEVTIHEESKYKPGTENESGCLIGKSKFLAKT